jgi:hypothetical protein
MRDVLEVIMFRNGVWHGVVRFVCGVPESAPLLHADVWSALHLALRFNQRTFTVGGDTYEIRRKNRS